MARIELQTVVDRLVREHLAGRKIVRVAANYAKDFDGETVLDVTIVIDEKVGKFDPGRLVSLARHLRSGLETIDVSAFPQIRFMSKSEAREMAA